MIPGQFQDNVEISGQLGALKRSLQSPTEEFLIDENVLLLINDTRGLV